jgi:hypothetical protein
MGAPSVLARKGFAALIGAKPFDVRFGGAFLAANVAAALASLMWLAGTTQYSVPADYWIFALAQACIFTAAASVGFRLMRNVWLASLVAAAMSTVVALPFWNSLPTFVFADIIYREQFQQFILLPFVSSFILLAALALLTPRLQPLPLALWAGAMCAEIITTVTANLLRTLGAGEPPDALLASTSLLSAIVRSVVFAAVLWGVLVVVKEASRAKPSLEAS